MANAMNRRTFNQLLGTASTIPFVAPFSIFDFPANPMDRIAMSTVNFRDRFASTREEGTEDAGQLLSLKEIPAYFADRFKLHLVEFWSPHFESIAPAYLEELKATIQKSKSRLINIQCDEAYELGAPDPIKRKEGLELALQWLDAAEMLGAEAIRFNPGEGDLTYIIEALKTINEVAKKKGIILMTENHWGIETDAELHLKILQQVGENMYSLPDFGNYPTEIRYASLQKIIPYAYQISAKSGDFDKKGNHIGFDFDRCMKMVVDSGFKGIYSVEQWGDKPGKVNDEKVADWMIERVKAFLS